MNTNERMEIERLHTSGMGYRKIAKETDVPENTVKSYLRRLKADELKCPVCGKPLISCGKAFSSYGNADRKYCSRECYLKDRFEGGCHD